MTNTCLVCGKQFKAKQSNYTLCSDECREVRRRYRVSLKFNDPEYKESRRRYDKQYQKSHYVKKTFYCKICGKIIVQSDKERKTMHDECALQKAAEYYNKNGGRLNKMHYCRIYSRGYCIQDVIDRVKDGGNNEHR